MTSASDDASEDYVDYRFAPGDVCNINLTATDGDTAILVAIWEEN